MLFIVVCSNLAVCIFILFIRASGNWEYCHWNATKRIIAGASGLLLLPSNKKGRWMKHLVELLSWRTLVELCCSFSPPPCQSDSLLCQLFTSKTKVIILPLVVAGAALYAPPLVYRYPQHAVWHAAGAKYEETTPGHTWPHTLGPSSPGLCRVWYSLRTYCCLWWWVRSPVPATSPCRWSFACSGISSLDSLSSQPNLSPVAAWECISHWAN